MSPLSPSTFNSEHTLDILTRRSWSICTALRILRADEICCCSFSCSSWYDSRNAFGSLSNRALSSTIFTLSSASLTVPTCACIPNRSSS
uniref:Oy1 n=1 Tax=Arundo donax TaxID=35708 RepID=A0A0A9CRD9_ARUDO